MSEPQAGATTIDLIMDSNINKNGDPVTEQTEDKGLVNWYKASSLCMYGPVDAMTALYNSTVNWTNVNPLDYSYYDKETIGATNGYISFISQKGKSKINALNGTVVEIGSEDKPLRARMSIYTEVSAMENTNEYLYVNLTSSYSGYWTLTTYETTQVWAKIKERGWIVAYQTSNNFGVRPVITLEI